jgi:hypothetical protein
VAKINEKQVLDWFDFDGLKYSVVDCGENVRKVQIELVEGCRNELRLTQFVDYLNQELEKQFADERTELGGIKARLAVLEETIERLTETELDVSVFDSIVTKDAAGEQPPTTGSE